MEEPLNWVVSIKTHGFAIIPKAVGQIKSFNGAYEAGVYFNSKCTSAPRCHAAFFLSATKNQKGKLGLTLRRNRRSSAL